MNHNTMNAEQVNAIATATGLAADDWIEYSIDNYEVTITTSDGTFDARQYLDLADVPIEGESGKIEFIEGFNGDSYKIEWTPKSCAAHTNGRCTLRAGICTIAEFLAMTDYFAIDLFDESLSGIGYASFFDSMD